VFYGARSSIWVGSACGELTGEGALVGRTRDGDRGPGDESADKPDPLRLIRAGERRKPMPVGFGRALTREVQGEEREVIHG
jgi:hypothetical protein